MVTYRSPLEAAGAVVHCYKEFGSYQGDWYAKVTYRGQTGWVNGSYGSCCGCDELCAVMYNNDGEVPLDGIALIGKSHLEAMMSQKLVERYASQKADVSLEDKQALDWLRENAK